MEGLLDAIQLHQAGFITAVSSMGTSLSVEQRQALLRAGAKRLLMAYDGDTAGHRASGRLIEGHRGSAIARELELAVVALPSGSDPDTFIREKGPEAFRRLVANATHWLHRELEQLLVALQADPENLSVVRRCEREAKRLLALLPAGALWQRAEQRPGEALGVVPGVAPAPMGRPGDPAGRLRGGEGLGTLRGQCWWGEIRGRCSDGSQQASAIERAEFRALRLFLCSPVCRDPLAVLVISNDLYRRAQQCLVEAPRRLNQPVRSAHEDPLPRAILAICPQLEPDLAALPQRLCTMDAGAREVLLQAPEGELMAILDALEPVE